MHKVWDIIPGRSKDPLTDEQRWKNRIQSELISLHYSSKRKIEIYAPDEVCEFRGERFVHSDHCRCDEDYQESVDNLMSFGDIEPRYYEF